MPEKNAVAAGGKAGKKYGEQHCRQIHGNGEGRQADPGKQIGADQGNKQELAEADRDIGRNLAAEKHQRRDGKRPQADPDAGGAFLEDCAGNGNGGEKHAEQCPGRHILLHRIIGGCSGRLNCFPVFLQSKERLAEIGRQFQARQRLQCGGHPKAGPGLLEHPVQGDKLFLQGDGGQGHLQLGGDAGAQPRHGPGIKKNRYRRDGGLCRHLAVASPGQARGLPPEACGQVPGAGLYRPGSRRPVPLP